MDNKISLYLHIPFCIKRCSYCDFVTHTDNSNTLIKNYVDKICQEIESYLYENLTLNTIFFGGGTPSVLKIEYLDQIFSSINKTFNNNSVETTIEINPVNLNRANLKKYLDLGINRLSMGVQTFNEELLKEVNRDHSLKDIYKTYYAAREAGFKNYNLDLIFGLPNQNIDIWQETLNKAMELQPEHISLYCLDLHDNTPLFTNVEAGVFKLPQEEETIKMYDLAINFLSEKGFIHYEISNWSKPNFYAKHNLAYWKNDDYIGVGVSAASYHNKSRYTNTSDILEYLKLNDFNKNYVSQSQKEEIEETVFMGLRLLENGLDKNIFFKRFNIKFDDYYKNELKELINKKLIHNNENFIKVKSESIFISNDIFEYFIK
ncbi:MAG: radical SAM family heme chaperone HemW [Candidatus Sericytochromatia bacterium]